MKIRIPLHGLIGLILILIFWYINWYTEGLRTHWAFFPLWTGFMLFTDGLAVLAGRPSLILGRVWSFGALFLISVPLWWLFEWMNQRAEYWEYLPHDAFPPFEHALWSTWCFSTVVPAIFVTANGLAALPVFNRHLIKVSAGRTATGRVIYVASGVLMLAALLLWPQYGMAFMWVSLFFILDPVNHRLGRPSLMRGTARGDWRLVILMFASALLCGFFWEMWNIRAWPKWIYTFPYLDGWKIFEMPLVGYLGYLPFGLEVWAFTALVFPRFVTRFIEEVNNKSLATPG